MESERRERHDERKVRLKAGDSPVCRDDLARFSFSKCDVQAVVQGNAVAGGDFAGPRHQGEIGMQGGNVGTDRSVERLRLTDVDPLGSLGLQKGVKDFGREDVGGEEFVNVVASIIPQLDRLPAIYLW